MKYITVLDFEISRVFQYNLGKVKLHGTLTEIDEYYEKYITDKGHRLNNCEWMVHTVAGIIKNEFWNSAL